MSTPSSPPTSATYVPYLAYKSKRHSRNLSNPNTHLVPNQSPPPLSRPTSSGPGTPLTLLQPPKLHLDADDEYNQEPPPSSIRSGTYPDTSKDQPSVAESSAPESATPPHISRVNSAEKGAANSSAGLGLDPASSSGQTHHFVAPPSQGTSSMQPTPTKRTSTFRRLPAKSARNVPLPHSRTVSVASLPPRLPEKDVLLTSPTASIASSPLASPGLAISPSPLAPIPLAAPKLQESISFMSLSSAPPSVPTKSPPASKSSLPSTPSEAGPALYNRPSAPRIPAPYRPGFQPKGVYRPLTDDFLELRRSKRDGDGDGGIKRVERTKLERRLEKLITLHFPSPGEEAETHKEKARPGIRPLGNDNRRASSLFDFQSFRNMNINDAGDLWRGVVSGSLGEPKNDIRAAEQRITPWRDDATVSKCPLCLASFHPLTNRKHHCRLCGQIICSLPIKHPQRKTLCSILFVVDKQTRQIEEVGEGVDYGVKKRRPVGAASQQAKQEEEEKFLKGVRICRECRPVLLRQQYLQQAHVIPPFVKLYQNFISLEADIEESLPKFQELLMSLNHQDQPTKEASAARKRLLDSFAQYDRLAKKIRSLPCPNGPGSSQDRVQMAITTRASLFLQKNMFPLQSLPTPRSNANATAASKTNGTDSTNLPPDIDADLAHALQPLLEQESLLEVFVEEAQAQRKFEDVKTLKVNLAEIRREIERLLDGSDAQRR